MPTASVAHRPPRETTLELDLELIEDDPTLDGGDPSEEREAEAARALRRARSLLASGKLRPGTIGADAARAQLEACLSRAAKSATHASAVAWLRAKIAREAGLTDDAITELKRALHLTRDRAACRAIFGELADVYASRGEHTESSYYAKRAGRPVVTEPTRAIRNVRAIRPPPPPPPRPRSS